MPLSFSSSMGRHNRRHNNRRNRHNQSSPRRIIRLWRLLFRGGGGVGGVGPYSYYFPNTILLRPMCSLLLLLLFAAASWNYYYYFSSSEPLSSSSTSSSSSSSSSSSLLLFWLDDKKYQNQNQNRTRQEMSQQQSQPIIDESSSSSVAAEEEEDDDDRSNNNDNNNGSSLLLYDYYVPPPPSRALPTHRACDDSSQIIDGVLHVYMGDELGGTGTSLVQLIIGQLLYADDMRLKPWIYLNHQSQVIYDPTVHANNGGSVVGSTKTTNTFFKALVMGKNVTSIQRRDTNPWGLGHKRDVFEPGPPLSKMDVQEEAGEDNFDLVDKYQYQREIEVPKDTDGIWDHYFEPVSDFVPGDKSCENKLLVRLTPQQINPGVHGYSLKYSTRCWRYQYLPEYISKPHLSLYEWYEPQRARAHGIINKYFRFRQYLLNAATRVNPGCSRRDNPCLGLHIRHSDKAAKRRVIPVAEFLPYAQAFVKSCSQVVHDNNNNNLCPIYIATDSSIVLNEIQSTWPKDIVSRIRTSGKQVVRSNDRKAVFDYESHHRTNVEALMEILALSQCQFLVHGLSALSESSIWINLQLHNTSVNLEDPDKLSVEKFSTLVRMVIGGVPESKWPKPIGIDEWWNNNNNKMDVDVDVGRSSSREFENKKEEDNIISSGSTTTTSSNTVGILHIGSVNPNSGTVSAFFIDILNQLLYADKYHLKPWIHLIGDQHKNSSIIYDGQAHNSKANNSRDDYFHLGCWNNSEAIIVHGGVDDGCPPSPATTVADQRTKTTLLVEEIQRTNGIWGSYFEPVVPWDGHSAAAAALCDTSKPIIRIDQQHLSSSGRMGSFCDWTIHPWRYDNVPEDMWWNPPKSSPSSSSSLKAWYEPMRRTAHEIVNKYYRFRPYIQRRAAEVNPMATSSTNNTTTSNGSCLAVHFRNGDKTGKYRQKIKADKFLPYMNAFVKAGGQVIYVASDSNKPLNYLKRQHPDLWKNHIRTQGKYVVRTGNKGIGIMAKEDNNYPTHFLDDHHRVNSETFVDILAMSKCHLLLHTYSAVSEAAIYLNLDLHNNSVNLEDPGRINPEEFYQLSKKKNDNKQFKIIE